MVSDQVCLHMNKADRQITRPFNLSRNMGKYKEAMYLLRLLPRSQNTPRMNTIMAACRVGVVQVRRRLPGHLHETYRKPFKA